jgi:hypothetical protein
MPRKAIFLALFFWVRTEWHLDKAQQNRVFLGEWPEIGDRSEIGRPQFHAKPQFSRASTQ